MDKMSKRAILIGFTSKRNKNSVINEESMTEKSKKILRTCYRMVSTVTETYVLVMCLVNNNIRKVKKLVALTNRIKSTF